MMPTKITAFMMTVIQQKVIIHYGKNVKRDD